MSWILIRICKTRNLFSLESYEMFQAAHITYNIYEILFLRNKIIIFRDRLLSNACLLRLLAYSVIKF